MITDCTVSSHAKTPTPHAAAETYACRQETRKERSASAGTGTGTSGLALACACILLLLYEYSTVCTVPALWKSTLCYVCCAWCMNWSIIDVCAIIISFIILVSAVSPLVVRCPSSVARRLSPVVCRPSPISLCHKTEPVRRRRSRRRHHHHHPYRCCNAHEAKPSWNERPSRPR